MVVEVRSMSDTRSDTRLSEEVLFHDSEEEEGELLSYRFDQTQASK